MVRLRHDVHVWDRTRELISPPEMWNACAAPLFGATHMGALLSAIGFAAGDGPCASCHQNLTTDLNVEELLHIAHDHPTASRSIESSGSMRSTESGESVAGFTMRHVLGRGRLGKVRLCERSGELFAIKIFRRRDLSRSRHWDAELGAYRSALEDVRSEIAIMKKLRHPNVVRFVEVIDDPSSDKLYLILDYVPGGALLSDARCGPSSWQPLDEPVARRLLRDVVSGLAYLHAHGIIHQDLKPDNVLLDAHGRARIADFGVARFLHPPGGREAAWRAELQSEIERLKQLLETLHEETLSDDAHREGEAHDTSVGGRQSENVDALPPPSAALLPPNIHPPRAWAVAEAHASIRKPAPRMMIESSEGSLAFRAPETYACGPHDGRAADVWSVGVTLYVMLCGTLPFPMGAAPSKDEPGSAQAPADADSVGGGVGTDGVGGSDASEGGGVGEGGASGGTGGGSGSSLGSLAGAHGRVREELEVERAVCHQPLRFPCEQSTEEECASEQIPAEAVQVANGEVAHVTRPSAAARRLLAAMLAKRPEDRATIATIACDPWLTDSGAEPLGLPAIYEELEATQEELHRAISIRSPALDLAGGPADTSSARATMRSRSTLTGGKLVAGDRARSEASVVRPR